MTRDADSFFSKERTVKYGLFDGVYLHTLID